jgi:O-antigen ligase
MIKFASTPPLKYLAINRQILALMALLLVPLLLSRLLRTNYLAEILRSIPHLLDIICALVLVLTLWSAWKISREGTRVGQLVGVAMAILAILAVVFYFLAPWASSRDYNVLPYLFLMLAFAALVWIRPDEEEVEGVIATAAAVLAFSVLLDVYNYFDLRGFGGLAEDLNRRVLRPAGLMASRNYAGELLAICLPLLMFKRRLWPLVLIVALSIGFTRCRTAYIAVLLICFVIVISAPYLKARWLAVCVVLLGLLLPHVIPGQLQWNTPEPYQSTWSRLADLQHGSGKLRLEQHTETWRVARQQNSLLSGFGMGMYYRELRPSRPDLAINPYPSSDFLRVWADTGLLGLAAFLSLLVLAVVGSVQRFMIQPQWGAALMALLVCCLGDVPFYRPETIVAATMLIMTASGWTKKEASNEGNPAQAGG